MSSLEYAARHREYKYMLCVPPHKQLFNVRIRPVSHQNWILFLFHPRAALPVRCEHDLLIGRPKHNAAQIRQYFVLRQNTRRGGARRTNSASHVQPKPLRSAQNGSISLTLRDARRRGDKGVLLIALPGFTRGLFVVAVVFCVPSIFPIPPPFMSPPLPCLAKPGGVVHEPGAPVFRTPREIKNNGHSH